MRKARVTWTESIRQDIEQQGFRRDYRNLSSKNSGFIRCSCTFAARPLGSLRCLASIRKIVAEFRIRDSVPCGHEFEQNVHGFEREDPPPRHIPECDKNAC